jgi:hypothetical protein
VTEILEHATIEVLCIVDCDLIWNSITTDDVLPEIFLYSCQGHVGDGLLFDPLGEVFHRYNGKSVISLCGCEFANDIDAPTAAMAKMGRSATKARQETSIGERIFGKLCRLTLV